MFLSHSNAPISWLEFAINSYGERIVTIFLVLKLWVQYFAGFELQSFILLHYNNHLKDVDKTFADSDEAEK